MCYSQLRPQLGKGNRKPTWAFQNSEHIRQWSLSPFQHHHESALYIPCLLDSCLGGIFVPAWNKLSWSCFHHAYKKTSPVTLSKIKTPWKPGLDADPSAKSLQLSENYRPLTFPVENPASSADTEWGNQPGHRIAEILDTEGILVPLLLNILTRRCSEPPSPLSEESKWLCL